VGNYSSRSSSSKDACFGGPTGSEVEAERQLNSELFVELSKSESHDDRKMFLKQYEMPPISHPYGDICVLDPFKPRRNLCSSNDEGRKSGAVYNSKQIPAEDKQISVKLTEIFVRGLHQIESALSSCIVEPEEGFTVPKAVCYMEKLFPVLSEKIDLKSVLPIVLTNDECELTLKLELMHPDIAKLQATLCHAESIVHAKINLEGSQDSFQNSQSLNSLSESDMPFGYPRAQR
jgi:hypothetical protein